MRNNCVRCRICRAEIKWDRYDSHLLKVHGKTATAAKLKKMLNARPVSGGMLECTWCKYKVRKEDLKAHVESPHVGPKGGWVENGSADSNG